MNDMHLMHLKYIHMYTYKNMDRTWDNNSELFEDSDSISRHFRKKVLKAAY